MRKECLKRWARRRAALLGGTASLGDCGCALRHLLGLGGLVRGRAIAAYEQAFARQLDVGYGISFSSARVGLFALLRVLGVGPGDEVLLQVPTHIVVANAIRYAGARPVYVDCALDCFNMDLRQAEQKLTPRTKVLLIQHTFGIPAELDAVQALARKHRLIVIEDCVHALGATYDGKMLGSFGKAAFFSTEETKTISTTMGGMVVTDDPYLAARLRLFQAGCRWPSAWLTARYLLKFVFYHFLMEPHVHHYARALYELLGKRHPLPRPTSAAELAGERPARYEQRLSNAQAALGLRQLQRLEANLAHRRKLARLYRELLANLGVKAPRLPPGANPAFVRYPAWVEQRERVVALAAPCAVLGTWFTSVLEEALSPGSGDYRLGTCPNAEAAAEHLINFPTHPRVSAGDAAAMVAAVASYLHEAVSPGPVPAGAVPGVAADR